MPRRLPSLRALQVFEAVARHLSFSGAADELNVSPGAVSSQVSRLESSLGVRLFLRSTRSVSLSEDGVVLARACNRAFAGIAAGIDSVTDHPGRNILTIAVSTYVTTRWLSRRLGEFLVLGNGATVRLQHSVNVPDFDIEGVDLAIRWGNGHWPGCRADRWLPMTKRPMCSPRLLEGAAAIREPADILRHTLLRDVPAIDLWDEWLALARLDASDADHSLVLADPVVRVQAAVDAQGVVLADDFAREDLDGGRLVEPFDIEVSGYGYYVLTPEAAPERDVAVRFREWLLAQPGP